MSLSININMLERILREQLKYIWSYSISFQLLKKKIANRWAVRTVDGCPAISIDGDSAIIFSSSYRVNHFSFKALFWWIWHLMDRHPSQPSMRGSTDDPRSDVPTARPPSSSTISRSTTRGLQNIPFENYKILKPTLIRNSIFRKRKLFLVKRRHFPKFIVFIFFNFSRIF